MLDDFFKVTGRGSTIATEVRAGCISWMTMSYIMVVNPVIISKAGINGDLPPESVMAATALSASVGSFVVGVIGDAPLGLMPGMGLNAYFTFGICHNFGLSWQEALSCCFVSGLALLLLALCGVCHWVVSKVLSEHLKKAITVAIGIFQALIGFQVMGLVVMSKDTLVTLGDLELSNQKLILAIAGFCVISAMLVRGGVHGALLIGIWLMAGISWLLGISEPPQSAISMPRFDAAFAVDFSGWAPGGGKLQGHVVGSLVLLFVALFDLAGVQYGLFGIAGLLRGGTVPRSTSIFSSAAVGTMAGALLGTSPVIIANESSAGIVEGARTGLSAVVVAVLFLISAFLAPLLRAVPNTATAVPLVLIGAFMMSPVQGINWDNLRVAIPSFLTLTVVPFTYSIHSGIIAGILMDGFLALSVGVEEPAEVPADDNNAHCSPRLQISTPHAIFRGAPSTAEKVEKARQLLTELGHCSGIGGPGFAEKAAAASGGGSDAEDADGCREEALARALEAYIEGR